MTDTRHTVDTITPEALDQLYARIEDWRTAAGAGMTLADQLRRQLNDLRLAMVDVGLVKGTPDSDASLVRLLRAGLDAFWADMRKVDEKADRQLEELADTGRRFKAWGEEQQARAESAEVERDLAHERADGYANDIRRLHWAIRAVRAVRDLHEPAGGTCGTCADETGQAAAWPCSTTQALNEPEAER